MLVLQLIALSKAIIKQYKEEKKMKKTLFKRVLYTVLTLQLALIVSTKVTYAAFTDGVQAKYGTDFATFAEEQAAAGEFNIELAGESFVLMKNEDHALPLTPSEKYVSLFGTRSDNIILGGSGSGGGSAVGSSTVKQSLEAVGLKLNPTLVNIYSQTTAVLELPMSALASASSSYTMYDDAAIIVLSRTGSEFNDAALYKVAGHSDPLDHYYMVDDNEKALINEMGDRFEKVIVVINSAHPIEMGWLEDHAKVDAILWIGHTGTTGIMALGKVLIGEINPSGKTSDVYPAKFAKDPTWANFKGNIQSQIVRGVGADSNNVYTYYAGEGNANNVLAPLNNNTDGIASNDWAYYSYSRVMDSLGRTVTADGPSKGARYYATLDYEEGIYVGYRWYETAKADGFFDRDSNGVTVVDRIANTPAKHAGDLYYNRLDGVIYPFGYGLSYSSFDVQISSAKHDGATFVSNDVLNTAYGKDITIQIQVENTGKVAGKQVVQVYYSAPYVAGQVEKSSVTLIEFVKTKLLQPGQKQTLSITFKVQYMASFDYNDANSNGHAGYELDPGVYKIGLYDDSHTLFDSINASVIGPVVNYDQDADNGNALSVKFTGDGSWDGTRSDLDYYDSRRTSLVSETPMTYLSRANFDGTLPQAPVASDLKWTDDAIRILQAQVFYTSFNDLPTDPWYKSAADVAGWTQADDATLRVNGLTAIQLFEMSGVGYNDPSWDTFLNQLTFDELRALISSNRFTTPALAAIGKPASSDQDGPAQLKGGTFWVSEVNIASTWNKELAFKQGLFIGNESLFNGVQGWYGPGLNIHRNPAAGRNFEYYSQDGIHSGIIGAYVIKGASSKGITAYMKHLFLNDQETSRYTVSTFLTEQAIREIYAKPWEYAIKFGDASASMSGFNKVGLLSTTSHYTLYQGLLRDEFGFQYSSVTDMYGWGYSPGSSGDMAARLNITPLGTWTNSFGRNIEGSWDPVNKNVVVTFTENVTNGTKWTKDDATGTSTSTINATNSISINKINSRDFADYATTGILVNYATSTATGPSAAFKDATNMKNGTTLYQSGDTLVSYTQWHAVRTAAKSLLFAQVNSNTMKNGVVTTNVEQKSLVATQGVAIATAGLDIAQASLPNAVYTVAVNTVLPAGLSLSTAGKVTGTPSVAGTHTFSVTATIGGYIVVTTQHTIVVAPRFELSGLGSIQTILPVSGSIASADWFVGKVIGSGSTAATVTEVRYSLVNGMLPSGLVLSQNGTISGVATTAGTYQASILAQVFTNKTNYYEFTTPVSMSVVTADTNAVSQFSFDGNFASAPIQSFTVINGNTASPIAAPYRPGYLFTGWFTDVEATTAVDFSVAVSGNVVVYAGWLKVDAPQSALEAALDQIDAVIAAIDAQILAANGDITEVDGLITALNQAITAINTALTDLGQVDSTNSARIDTINQAITNLNTTLQSTNTQVGTINDQVDAINEELAKADPNRPLILTSIALGSIGVIGSLAAGAFIVLKKKH